MLAACSQFFYKFFQDFTQEPLVEIEGTSHTDRYVLINRQTVMIPNEGEMFHGPGSRPCSSGVSNSAFRHLVEFTYTAMLAVSGDEEVNDVWRAAEYLQMQEAIKALKSKSVISPSGTFHTP